MKAVVLAAGEGRRLEPLTNVRPKPMVPIANQPLLEYVIEAVADAGIRDVVLVVGYKRERIQSYFEDGDEWGVSIQYAVQDKQLGTGHAVLQAEPFLDDDFLVLNGDRIIESSVVTRLIEADRHAEYDVLMAVTRVDIPERFGVVDLEGDEVTAISEKPPPHAVTSNLINAGVYRFDRTIFERVRATGLSERGERELTMAIEQCIDRGAVRAIRYRGVWLDVSQLWDVITVNAEVLDRDCAGTAPSATIHDRASVSSATAIGRDTVIQPNATVLRGTSLGDNVRVGPNAVVANSVVLSDAAIEAGAVVRDCVIGENVRIGANTTIEGGDADVVVDNEFHADVTLGGAIGDNARVGGNATVSPGAIVGDGVTVESGSILAGRVPPNAEVRRG